MASNHTQTIYTRNYLFATAKDKPVNRLSAPFSSWSRNCGVCVQYSASLWRACENGRSDRNGWYSARLPSWFADGHCGWKTACCPGQNCSARTRRNGLRWRQTFLFSNLDDSNQRKTCLWYRAYSEHALFIVPRKQLRSERHHALISVH